MSCRLRPVLDIRRPCVVETMESMTKRRIHNDELPAQSATFSCYRRPPLPDRARVRRAVLFQRIWHKSRVWLSKSLLTGKWQRGLPKLYVLFSPAVPGLGRFVAADGVHLFRVAPIVVHQPQEAQGTVQPLFIVPTNDLVEDLHPVHARQQIVIL